jgi:ribosomal protein L18
MFHAMNRWRQFLMQGLVLGLLACFAGMGNWGVAADSLSWQPKQDKVAAEITSWDLPKLLEAIARATGWRIFLEPDTERRVSTKFKDRSQGEALSLLLGDLSFALLPQSNGPSRLLVFRTNMKEATQLIRAPENKSGATAKPIPNELILRLKPGAKAEELAKKLGAKIIGRVDGMNAYRFSFDSADAAAAAREQLKGSSDVDSIDYNYQVPRPEPSEALSASSAVAPPFTLKARDPGGAPIVGLIDTPIQRQGGNMDAFLLPGLSVGDSEVKPSDTDPTHGTSMYETILRGLALDNKDSSGVRILPVDVYGNNPMTTTFDVASGIYKGINGGATVINLSLGSDGDSSFLHDVIKAGVAQGVYFFAAAGNEPTAALSYPAAYPEVFAVTAVNRDGSIAPYANYGNFVDFGAPGTGIVIFNGQQWVVTGTSASSAYASGLAAGLVDGTKMTQAQFNTALGKYLPVKR